MRWITRDELVKIKGEEFVLDFERQPFVEDSDKGFDFGPFDFEVPEVRSRRFSSRKNRELIIQNEGESEFLYGSDMELV